MNEPVKRFTPEAAQMVRDSIREARENVVDRPREMDKLIKDTLSVSQTLMDTFAELVEANHQFEPIAKKYTEQVRLFRMTVVSETSVALKQLEDVRKFFLGPTHEEEVKRLREFVELCERLKALKDSGFLDNVADTLLKLA